MKKLFNNKVEGALQAKIAAAIFACVLMVSSIPHTINAQTADQITPSMTVTTFPRALLYVTGSKRAIESLKEHVTSTDIVAPQTYSSTPSGKLLGKPNAQILQIARDANADIMPLVSNQNFSQPGINTFLHAPAAQDKLIASLIAEAQDKKYIGYQYDFEHIPSYDRDLYSAFVAKSAPLFHNAGLKLSVAIAPIHSENPNDLPATSWQNWTGAFDYSSIGASADFVSVMAYDDALSVGPTASIPWITQVANYTLAHIPANKVSFGIPFYAWVRNTNTGKRVSIVGYPALASMLDNGTYISKGWSDALGVPWVTYKIKGRVLTAWYEDSDSFSKKMDLIQSDHMAGYSVWALGLEDPKVWDIVTAMRDAASQVAER